MLMPALIEHELNNCCSQRVTIHRTGQHRTHTGPHRARTLPEMFTSTTVTSRIKA